MTACDPKRPLAIAALSTWIGEGKRRLVDLKHRVVRADGLTCPHCDGPINFVTPYYGRDECDLDSQMVGIWTWWPFVPFAELISAFRAMTGNSPGMVKKLYHCVQCDVDLSYKEAKKVAA